MAVDTWRERDLRGKHGPTPRSVSSVVLRVNAALNLARIGESCLFAFAGFALTQASVAASHGDTRDPEALGLAVLMGCLVGVCWWRTHRSDTGSVARALDRRLRHGGGLVTAFELEGGGQPVTGGGALGELLVVRVLRRLRLSEALRAMFPPLVVPIAAPLVGLGLLVLALEGDDEDELATRDWSQLAVGMLGAFDALEEAVLEANADGALRNDDLGGLLRAVNTARSIERRREVLASAPETSAAGRAELSELARDLAELAARTRGLREDERADRLEDRIEEARNWVEAARAGLGGDASAAAPEPGAVARAPGADGNTRSSSSVTDASENGTMEPSTVEADVLPASDDMASTPESSLRSEEAGTLAADYWPEAYDGVVAGWIERTRMRKEPRTR